MSNDYRPGGQQRRNRRSSGGRYRDRDRDNDSGKSGAPKKNEKKEGFFAKLLAIFTGKKAPVQPPRKFDDDPRPERPDGQRRERGERDRNRGGRRGDRDGQRPERQPREDRPEGEADTARPDPTPVEITTPRLYVGNLSYDVSESDLFDLFASAGKVRNIEIARDRTTERSKGFGFAEMESLDDAKSAQAKLQGYEFQGRPLVVSGAKAPTHRGGRRES